MENKNFDYRDDLFRLLVDLSNDAIFLASVDNGSIIYANQKAQELTGFSLEELRSCHQTDLHPKEDKIFYQQLFKKAASKQKTSFVVEDLYLKNKSGESIPVTLSTNVVLHDGEKIIQGVFRDVTTQKQIDNQFKLLQISFDKASVSIFWVDKEGRFSYVNDYACDLLGYTKKEMLSMKVADIDLNYPENKWLEHWNKLRRYKQFCLETAHKTKTGKIIPMELTVHYIQHAGKEYNFAFAQDITERKKSEEVVYKARLELESKIQKRTAELARINVDLQDEIKMRIKIADELQRTSEKYKRLVEGLKKEYFFYIQDIKGVFTYVSPSITNILGFTQNEFMVHFTTFLTDNPINKKVVEKTELGLKGIQQDAYMVETVDKKGSMHQLEVLEFPVFDKNGKVVSLEGIARDITELRKKDLELRFSEERYHSLVENINIGISVISPKMEVLAINKKMKEWFGDIKVEEKPICYEVFNDPPGKGVCSYCPVINAIEDGEVYESVTETPSGNATRNFRIVATPLKDEKGNVSSVIEAVEDITQVRLRELKLIESEEKLNKIVTSITDYIYKVRIFNGKVIETSHGPGCAKVTGYSELDFAKNPGLWIDIVYKDDKENVLDWSKNILSEKKVFSIEHRIIHKDNSMRWIRNTPMLTHNDKGELILYEGIVQDITQEKIAQEEKQINDSLSLIIENLPDVVLLTDMSLKIMSFNKALSEKYSYGNEVIKKEPFLLFSEADKGKTRPKLEELLEQGSIRNFEIDSFTKDGKKIPVLVDATVYKDRQGSPIGTISILTDITEKKNLEQMKVDFINTIIHELRSPLAAIKESTLCLMEGELGSLSVKQKEVLKITRNNIDRLVSSTSNFLDFEKIESGCLSLDLKTSDINKIVKEVHKELYYLCKNKGLEFVIKKESKLPKLLLDRDRIKEVLVNLINNAVKFTGKGHIRIITSKQKDSVLVCVEDTGVGISGEDCIKLFRPFFQISKTKPKNGSRGSGLGLPISKKIIEQHKGSIWVESAPGKGSKFFFSLPVKP